MIQLVILCATLSNNAVVLVLCFVMVFSFVGAVVLRTGRAGHRGQIEDATRDVRKDPHNPLHKIDLCQSSKLKAACYHNHCLQAER